MDSVHKIELNKRIKEYHGSNTFILSLQKYLKKTKNYFEVEVNGKIKKHKELSDKQYNSAKETLDSISI